MNRSHHSARGLAAELAPEDLELLRRGIRLNTVLLGVVTGIGVGLAIVVVTHISLFVTGGNAGRYLNLLGIFLPGYSVSFGGAWIGAFWGFVAGFVSGSFAYRMYSRTIGREFLNLVSHDAGVESFLEQPTLRLSGQSLGLALGCLMAAQLYLATTWLIIRGTADQSVHAALLTHYFPGYSVSYLGGLYGSVSIFAFTYLASLVLAAIYNFLVYIKK